MAKRADLLSMTQDRQEFAQTWSCGVESPFAPVPDVLRQNSAIVNQAKVGDDMLRKGATRWDA